MKKIVTIMIVSTNFLFSPYALGGAVIYTVKSPGEAPTSGSYVASGVDIATSQGSENPSYEVGKDFVINKKIQLSYCSYSVRKGDWFAKVLRKFGYRRPYSMNLVSAAKSRNSHIKNIDQIEKGDVVFLPIMHLENREVSGEQGNCETLLASHKKEPFLIQGPEANFEKQEEQVVFYLGKSHEVINQGLPEPFRILASTEEYDSSGNEQNLVDLPSEFSASEEVSEVNYETVKSELLFSLGGHYDSLYGRKGVGKTVFVSELGYSLGLEWKQHWNQRWKSFLGVNTVFRKYKKSLSANKSIQNRENTESTIYGGGEYLWSDMSFAQFALGAEESIYYQQAYENIYSIRKGLGLMFQGRLSQRLFSKGGLGIAGLAHLNYSPQGLQDFKGGTDYGLGLSIKHQVSQKSSINATLIYHQGEFKSSWFSFERRWLDFVLRYGVDF